MMHERGKSDGPIVPAKSRTTVSAIGSTQVVRCCRLRRAWREVGQPWGINVRAAPTGHRAGLSGCHWLSCRYGGRGFGFFMLLPSSRHHPRQEPDAVIPLVRICAGAGRKARPFRDRNARLRIAITGRTTQTDQGAYRVSAISHVSPRKPTAPIPSRTWARVPNIILSPALPYNAPSSRPARNPAT